MADLNSAMLSSLLTINSFLNVQDTADSGAVTVSGENQNSDENNHIEPDAFVLLFAQMMAHDPELYDDELPLKQLLQKSEPVTVQPEKASETQQEREESEQDKQVMSELEDNVAVVWINSAQYKPEIKQNLNTAIEQEDDSLIKTEIKTEFLTKPSVLNETAPLDTESDASNEQHVEATPNVPVRNILNKNEFLTDNSTSKQPINPNNIMVELPEDSQLLEAQEVQPIFNSLDEVLQYSKINKSNDALDNDTFAKGEDDAVTIIPDQEFVMAVKPEKNQISVEKNVLPVEKNVLSDDMKIEFSEHQSEYQLEQHSEIKSPETLIPDNLNPVASPKTNSAPQSIEPPVIQNQLISSNEVSVGNKIFDLPAAQTLDIPADVDNPEWPIQFSEQIIWLGQQGIKSALIKIHPEDLGPLEININVIKDSASVTIMSHDPHVRDIIDQSLPRLQEMMAEQGLNLSEVQIDSESDTRQFAQQNDDTSEQFAHDIEEDVLITPLNSNKKHPKGIIDYFA